MPFSAFLLPWLLGMGTVAAATPLTGDWSGNLTQDGTMFACQLSVHINQTSNRLTGQLRYEWPNQHFVTWSFFGSLYGTDSIVLDENLRPDSTNLTTSEIASWSPRRLTGKLTAGINSFVVTGTWTNARGTVDTAHTYNQLGTAKKGIVSLRRTETATELLSDYVTTHMSNWKTVHSKEKSDSGAVTAQQDAFATEFFTYYFRMRRATLVYNVTSARYQVSLDGCDPFNMSVSSDEADTFKKGCTDLSLKRNLLVHFVAPGQNAVVVCFRFTTKLNSPDSVKTYSYGVCP